MKDSKQIKWLLEELPELERSGIVDSAAKEKLIRHYTAKLAGADDAQKCFLWGMLAIGILLIAGGVILLTAHNWDMMPKVWKVTLTFLPLVFFSAFGIVTLIRGWKQEAFEISAVGIAASVASLIALISQIYHTGGSLFAFLTLVLGLSLPLIYIFNSVILGVIFPFGLLWYSVMLWDDGSAWLPFGYTLFWLPFAVWRLRKTETGGAVVMRYGLLAGSAALIVQVVSDRGIGDLPLALLICAASVFFMIAGFDQHDGKKAKFGNPWFGISYCVITVVLLCWSCGDAWSSCHLKAWNLFFWLVWGCFLIASFFFLLKKITVEKLFVFLFSFFPFLFLMFKDNGSLCAGAATVYLAVFGLLLAVSGFRKRDLLRLNLGMLQLLALVLCRFFESGSGIFYRAVVFICFGILILFVNASLSRRFCRNKVVKGDGNYE